MRVYQFRHLGLGATAADATRNRKPASLVRHGALVNGRLAASGTQQEYSVARRKKAQSARDATRIGSGKRRSTTTQSQVGSSSSTTLTEHGAPMGFDEVAARSG
jgi:hypothetical protein